MTKQRLFKMTPLQRDVLTKVLCDTQKEFSPVQAEKMQALREKAEKSHKGRLYLNDEEFDCAMQALNTIRNAYLSAGRSSACFDRILLLLLGSKYRRLPAQYR